MSHPSPPEPPTPEDVSPSTTRRRIRVTGGQLLRDAVDPGVPLPAIAAAPPVVSGAPTGGERQPGRPRGDSPEGSRVAAGPAPGQAATGNHFPVEITGFFRHLHDTAQALSQQIGQLTVGRPGLSTLPPEEARPLPMHQRRPQRVEAGRVSAKRSSRFNTPGDPASVAPASFPGPEGAVTNLPELERNPSDASGAADPSVPLPASVHDLTSGGALLAPFQPRQGHATPGEGASAPATATRLPWVALGGTFAVGLLAGWFLLRTLSPGAARPPAGASGTRSNPTNAPLTTPSPTDPAALARANGLVNQALRAEKSGDVSRAVELFAGAEKACPDFPGIRYRLALLALRQGDRIKARTLMSRSLAAGEEVAAVHNLRSALARQENQAQIGFMELEAATRSDPFNPTYHYYWAEALRRVGRLPEAADRLEDALVRTAEPTDEALYQFKLRLVKIELNREDEFANDLAARLQGTNPAPAEWLLTAAALAIKRGDYAAAAAYVDRGRQLLAPPVAAFLLNDQTFRDNAWRPELVPFYAGPPLNPASPGHPQTAPAPGDTSPPAAIRADRPAPGPAPVGKPRPGP